MIDPFKKMIRRVGKRQNCQVWAKGYPDGGLRIFEAKSLISCSRLAKKLRKEGRKVEVVKAGR